jgi:predicted DCC family thiol-disulfide oxidoreductase YuxK
MEIPEAGHAIKRLVVYDGQCNFCVACIDFIKRKSSPHQFIFIDFHKADVALIEFLSANGLKEFNTVVYVENGNVFFRSTAVLKILRRMKIPYRWFYILMIVPVFLRDGIYKLVAGNRNKIFACKGE